jgi:hypothetical protein
VLPRIVRPLRGAVHLPVTGTVGERGFAISGIVLRWFANDAVPFRDSSVPTRSRRARRKETGLLPLAGMAFPRARCRALPAAPTPDGPRARARPRPDPSPERDPSPGELEEGSRAFDAAPPEQRDAVVAEITRRIEATREPSLRLLRGWRDRAVKELKVVAAPAPEYYDPKIYARGLVNRVAASPSDTDAAEQRELSAGRTRASTSGRCATTSGATTGSTAAAR